MRKYAAIVCLLLSCRAVAADAGAPASPALGDLSKVGTVDFPTSCSPEVEAEFLRGVALLHSFFYDEARRVFTEVSERDPACAMAHWGVAMTWFHPIWAPPTPDEHAAGLAAVERAEASGGRTARERDYIAAVAAFYRAARGATAAPIEQTCHGPTSAEAGRAAFRAALERLHLAHPDDPEAAAFYALSLIKSNPLAEDLPVQRKAAEILEPLWREHPDHPGIVHYLIHAYDHPTLAARGLAAADHYAKIAPWVPHALHMPSHIYTRLGMWEESIHSNAASAEASRAYAARFHPGATYFEELHALDYLVYAHLQRGEDTAARVLVERAARVDTTYPEVDFAAAHALGAMPARYVLERQAWEEAVALRPAAGKLAARFPFDAAHVELARAIGQLRTDRVDDARKTRERIERLRAETTDPRFAYFRRQLEVQLLALGGLLAQAEDRTDEAIALLRYAADEDDALGKSPVSPGSLVPVRELLGQLMLDLGRPAEALAAFERSLELNPGRFNALVGAGRAAELAGRAEAAREHYRGLLALAEAGDGTRPALARARSFLEGDVSERRP
jgi:tetratricopeptide (TPR) repeat protein